MGNKHNALKLNDPKKNLLCVNLNENLRAQNEFLTSIQKKCNSKCSSRITLENHTKYPLEYLECSNENFSTNVLDAFSESSIDANGNRITHSIPSYFRGAIYHASKDNATNESTGFFSFKIALNCTVYKIICSFKTSSSKSNCGIQIRSQDEDKTDIEVSEINQNLHNITNVSNEMNNSEWHFCSKACKQFEITCSFTNGPSSQYDFKVVKLLYDPEMTRKKSNCKLNSRKFSACSIEKSLTNMLSSKKSLKPNKKREQEISSKEDSSLEACMQDNLLKELEFLVSRKNNFVRVQERMSFDAASRELTRNDLILLKQYEILNKNLRKIMYNDTFLFSDRKKKLIFNLLDKLVEKN